MTTPGQVMSVEVNADVSLQTGAPKLLFHPETTNVNMPQFGVTDNGQKFLVIETPPMQVSEERMLVMTHWTAASLQQ
jgi:hypothetical protein